MSVEHLSKLSVRDDETCAGPHDVYSARSIDASASSVFSSPICRLEQQPFTLLVDSNNLTIRPNADDALQFQWYSPSSPERSAGFRALDGLQLDNEIPILPQQESSTIHGIRGAIAVCSLMT
jgi:hypothetical protein